MAYDSASPTPEALPTELQKTILPDDKKWTDEYALSVVKSDWAYAESYRTNAHDWRYRNAMELYLAWAGQRYWDGTRVPRSSLGMYVVFEQVEAMLPKVLGAVTSSDMFHFTAAMGEENENVPMAWKELIVSQLGEVKFREQIQQCIKSMEIYGNGVIEVGWETYEEEYINFTQRMTRPKQSFVNHPIVGPVPIATQPKVDYARTITKEKKGRPYLRYVSLIDFYVDPSCESMVIQEGAGYVIKRQYMSVGKIKSMRTTEGFKIPSDAELTNLSKAKSTANQDVTKLSAELFRYNMWNPSQDYTSDPAQKRIAVIEYTTPTRKVWWLQGSEFVIYNQPNQYGMINYFSVPYANVLDRWHGLSIADVAEGEQRLQGAIINARIDELAIGIHKPMVKRRGVTIPQYQLKIRPGVVLETENPEGDIRQLEPSNITQQAFIEVEASDRRVQRTTGMSDLAALGTPSSGGNSANRTATGVNTQQSATQGRVTYIVENIESMIVEPALNFIIKLNRKFMDIKTATNWLKIDKRFSQLNPLQVMNTRVSCECRGSTKMAARSGFMQMLPILSQVILNPELMQQLGQQTQQTIDVREFVYMIEDALNYSPRNPLVVPLTPQQIKAAQQPPPQEMMKLQAAQQQSQSNENINEKRIQGKMLETIFKALIDKHGDYEQIDQDEANSRRDMAMRLMEMLSEHSLQDKQIDSDEGMHTEKMAVDRIKKKQSGGGNK